MSKIYGQRNREPHLDELQYYMIAHRVSHFDRKESQNMLNGGSHFQNVGLNAIAVAETNRA